MLELEDAVQRILTAIPAPQPENTPLAQAQGRVLLKSLCSPLDFPPFDNSAMDGYAVRAADLGLARSEAPVRLRMVGKVAAGEHFTGELSPGTCVRLFTGSALPRGADAVVMQEDTRVEGPTTIEVLVLTPATPGENVRFQGEDIRRGDTLVSAGERLNFAQLAVLAAAGHAQVATGSRPRVGILATGSELREPGAALGPGQIYESNRVALEALVRQVGGIPVVYPIVRDARTATREALERAFAETDVVITCGGASVGEMDFIKEAFQDAGGELEFWKVAIKPGRPFVFGRRGGRLLFGLPGNPVSALVTFLLLVRPALLGWQGASNQVLAAYPGILEEALENSGSRRHFVRVWADPLGRVKSAGVQASHMLRSLAGANGLVDVPADSVLPAGANVRVLRWD
jgi:molybdopterin molybdotransferase